MVADTLTYTHVAPESGDVSLLTEIKSRPQSDTLSRVQVRKQTKLSEIHFDTVIVK